MFLSLNNSMHVCLSMPGIVGVSLPLPYRASAEAIASAENVALFSSSNPGLSWTMTKSQKQLYYPMWMEGTWKVHGISV